MNLDTVIVALHGVFDGQTNRWQGVPAHLKEGDLSYQLLKSVELAQKHNTRCLVLSGGYTRPEFPNLNEAETARNFLRKFGSLPPNLDPVLESFARDSAENLFFGILAAWNHLGELPDSAGFVSFRIKETRMAIVRSALSCPVNYRFLPVDPPFADFDQLEDWKSKENENVQLIADDPTQRNAKHFVDKRDRRTPKTYNDNSAYLDAVAKEYPIGKFLIDQWKAGKNLEWQ